MSADALAVWRDSFTRRWHANPDLSHTTDFNCAHQGRVALLVLCLFPDASPGLLRAAVTHDQGEAGVGDLPFPLKQADPALFARLDALEAAHMERRGLTPIGLHPDDLRRLKLCDRLDAVLWMLRERPALAETAQWQGDIAFCRAECEAMGVRCPV